MYHGPVIKGSAARPVEHGVDRLFVDRWSPRAMSGEPIPLAELQVLFEAARWAPSAGNQQPWRILFGRRDTPEWPLFYELLNPGNRPWCLNAAALLLFVSRMVNAEGRPIATHAYDTGAAWENLALQGTLRGLVVHGMAGFNHELARDVLKIPADYHVNAMAAVGRPGRAEDLSESLQAREKPSPRKPLSEIVVEGAFRS
jgi:nitroreductase